MKPQTLAETAVRPCPDFSQLLKVLRRDGQPAYVPFYELYANPGIMGKILGKPITDRVGTVEFYHRTGYDYVPVWPGFSLKAGNLADTRKGYPITDRDRFAAYQWAAPSSVTFTEFDHVARVLPKGMKIIGQMGGVFETVESLCGYEGLCMLLADDRKLVREIFDHVGVLYEAAYTGMARHESVGAVVISDDLGFKTQTLISPDDLREYVLPWHRKLAKIIHDHGKPCILHSCGNLEAIMDDLIDRVKIDAKHSYEDTILPVAEAKQRYGKRIAILGGYDVDRLCRGTETEIRKDVDFLVGTLGKDGGYALGSGNSIADYVPVENYLTMLDQGWKRRG